jgi:hypothetical protein
MNELEGPFARWFRKGKVIKFLLVGVNNLFVDMVNNLNKGLNTPPAILSIILLLIILSPISTPLEPFQGQVKIGHHRELINLKDRKRPTRI